MSELTNLTDRLAHLRDRKGDSTFAQSSPPPVTPNGVSSKPARERKFSTDTFMMFVYGLLGVALCIQVFLIVWLDII